MGEQADVTTTATTREMQVTAQPDVVYNAPALGGAGYVVVPHPPTPRDRDQREP